jgi:DNA (cytosine-5)-methyltransferase 1
MTFGSLFAGAGGFDMGLEAAGLRCAWQVEIDKTARSVLARHWPDVPKLPDVRKCGAADLAVVDVLVGGFPCQDLSHAGNRAGLGGERSGLWWEMLRVIRELQPGLVVFENVPGLRTSDDGRDYPRVLSSLAEHGYFGCVRTLDAQHFGVPQSRPRLFGVFARRSDGAGRACEILAVRESLSGHSAAGREAESGIAPSVTPGARRASGQRAGELPHVFGDNDTRGERTVATAINAKGGTGRQDFETENFVLQCHGSNVGPFGTLRRGNGGVTGGVPFTFRTAGDGAVYGGDQIVAPLTTATDPCANIAQVGAAVRRFTPRECERLMGWPDDWTRWRDNGKEIADGPRYRLTGNGVVRPVALWLGLRLFQA